VPYITNIFSEKPLKWFFEFKARNNDKAKRNEFYEIIKSAINSTGHVHQINADYADYDIIVEVFRDVLLFSILP
jgi:hypothetical protein